MYRHIGVCLAVKESCNHYTKKVMATVFWDAKSIIHVGSLQSQKLVPTMPSYFTN